MTGKQIKEQVRDIQQVTKTVSVTKETAAAFLRSAGIARGGASKSAEGKAHTRKHT